MSTRHAPDQAESLRRLIAAPSRAAAAPHAYAIAISSGKGGVGKTTIAVNLAIALRLRGHRVGLIDADLGMANADVMCGLSPRRRLDALATDADIALADIAVPGPAGIVLVPGCVGVSPLLTPGPTEQRRLAGAIRELDALCDIVLIDTGAGIGPGVVSMAAVADACLVVATPDPASVADAYAFIKALLPLRRDRGFDDASIPLLVNAAASASEAAGVADRIAAVAARFLGCDLRRTSPLLASPLIAVGVRARRPFMLDAPDSPAGRSLRAIAQELTAATAPQEARHAAPRPERRPPWLARWLRGNPGLATTSG